MNQDQNPLNLLVEAIDQVEVDRAIRRIFLGVFQMTGLVGRTSDGRTRSRPPDSAKTQVEVVEWIQHGPNHVNLEVDEQVLEVALQEFDRYIVLGWRLRRKLFNGQYWLWCEDMDHRPQHLINFPLVPLAPGTPLLPAHEWL